MSSQTLKVHLTPFTAWRERPQRLQPNCQGLMSICKTRIEEPRWNRSPEYHIVVEGAGGGGWIAAVKSPYALCPPIEEAADRTLRTIISMWQCKYSPFEDPLSHSLTSLSVSDIRVKFSVLGAMTLGVTVIWWCLCSWSLILGLPLPITTSRSCLPLLTSLLQGSSPPWLLQGLKHHCKHFFHTPGIDSHRKVLLCTFTSVLTRGTTPWM